MTRNCPHPAYLVPSIFSFFSTTHPLLNGLAVYTFFPSSPANPPIVLVDLESLSKISTNEQVTDLLSQDESRLLASFSYPKRKTEWLGGRIAAKAATLHLLQRNFTSEDFAKLSILPRKNGSPQIFGSAPTKFLPAISISHSKKFAVAMAAAMPNCGIDIQKISEQTLRVVSRFATPPERQILKDNLPELTVPQRLSLLWSAKEAVKKAFLDDQPIIFEGIELKELYCNDLLHFFLHIGNEKRLLTVNCVLLDEYALAFTTQAKPHA